MAKPVDARRQLLVESRERTKRRRRGLVVVLVIGAVLVIGVFFGLLHYPAVHVTTVTIKGNQTIPAGEVQKIVERSLQGSRFFIIPNNVSWLIDKQILGEKLAAEFSNIRQVAIELEGFSELIVTISEREQKVLWCANSQQVVSDASTQTCWYTDATGVLFAPAPNFSDSVVLKLSGLINSPDQVVGTRILPQEEFVSLLKTVEALPQVIAAAGINPTRPKRVILDRHDDVRLVISGRQTTASTSVSGDWEVLFNRDQALTELIKNLTTVLSAPEFKADIGQASSLAYIDLRFGKKVFYKFKQ